MREDPPGASNTNLISVVSKDAMEKRSPWILPTIIFSEFMATSLWFASNAILGDLRLQWSLGSNALGYMTSAVQLGFIVGTLCFALFAISDRFSPRIVFFVCSLLGAFSNLLICLVAEGLISLLALRLITGFFLAGLYPVGMKIASGWYKRRLGNALGALVGALVVGSALSYLLKGAAQSVPWEAVIISISMISFGGGILMLLLVPDGPYLVKGASLKPAALVEIFRSKGLRSSACGYFGHMWELYTLWAFVPVVLSTYVSNHPEVSINISFWTFCIIASGGLGCIGGGIISKKVGSAPVAFVQLASSGICCLLSPLIVLSSIELLLGFFIIWGIVVVGDSPQFSALIAKSAPQELVGSALTIVNCIGFSITIVSIQVTSYLFNLIHPHFIFFPLAVGPAMGLVSLWPLLRSEPK
jgi:MFS family permease